MANRGVNWIAVGALGTVVLAAIAAMGRLDDRTQPPTPPPMTPTREDPSGVAEPTPVAAASEPSCPTSSDSAAATFGGRADRWDRLSSNSWKYVRGSPPLNISVGRQMSIHWWDNFRTHEDYGPGTFGPATEATVYC